LLVFFSVSSFAQNNRIIQFDLGLAQTHKDFFRLYDGIFELGGSYHFGVTRNFYTGISFHINYLNRNNGDMRVLVYKPKINLQYYFHVSKGIAIVPGISVGYSLLQMKNNEYDFSDLQNGVNLCPDLKIVFTRQAKTEFYLYGRFDYIYLSEDKAFTKLNNYRNVYLTSFGLGINIKSYGQKK